MTGIFRRKPDKEPLRRAYYASDIHGSEVLWRKFLNAAAAYNSEVLIMGGDVTGKVVVPFVERPDGIHVELFGDKQIVQGDAIEELANKVRANGMYPHRMTPEEVERVSRISAEEKEDWFAVVMRETFDQWLALAEERLQATTRCFVMPGNDDPAGVDSAIEDAGKVEACDGRIVEFDGYTMISLGYSNRTPFDSPRELEEDELYQRVSVLAEQVKDRSRCIFNLHVPPYDSSLDTAPQLNDKLEVVMSGSAPKMISAGSTAVRQLVEDYQPMLSLHGHIHESPGAIRIGRTLSINPGSDYHTGRISGCLLQLRGSEARHQFVTG